MNAMLEQINAAGGAFVNFAGPMLVQVSVLILIILAIDLLLKKKVRAVFRYWLWMLVLAKLVLPVTLSSPFSLGYLIGDQLNVEVNVQEPAAELGFVLQGPLAVEGIDSVPIEAPEAVEAFRPASAEGVGQPVSAAVVSPLRWEGIIFLVWAAIVVVMALMLLQRAFFVFGLVAQAAEAGGTMEDILERCKEKMGIRGKIGLKLSANATSPAVCGLVRPVILVPQDLEARLDGSEMRAVLMHELAHIRRGDLWVNLAQTVLQIVYFYNPLLWVANAIIRRVREQAVDEAVLVAMGDSARQYPRTLVNVAKLAFGRPALSLRLIGVVESKSALKGRIKRILERPLPKSAKLGIAGLIMVLFFGSVLLPMAKFEPPPPGFVIKGTVTDADTGEPVAGAKVGDNKEYNDGKFCTVTDSNGNYEYKTWYEEHGTVAEADGYKAQLKGFNTKLFGSEKEKVINFELTRVGDSGPSEFEATSPNGLTVEDSRNLLIERRDILQKELQTVEHKSETGRAVFKELQQAKIDLLRVESELAETPQKRIDILDQIVTLYLEQEKRTQLLLDAGRATRGDELNEVKLLRLDAENELAKAKAEGNNQQADFKATLPGGVTVELISVSNYPDNTVCWQPDGSQSKENLFVRVEENKRQDNIGFVAKISGPDDMGISYGPVGGAKGHSGHNRVIGKSGEALDGYTSLKALITDGREFTSITFGISTSPWQTLATHTGRGGTTTGSKMIIFSRAFETKDSVGITVSSNRDRPRAERIVAIDKNGQIYTTGNSSSLVSNDLDQLTVEFHDLRLKDISEFAFQARPYEWVEFKNVSLKPNFKTDVQIEVEPIKKSNMLSKSPEAEPLILLGMQLIDVTPELKAEYQLYHPFGVLILDPGFGHQRLGIGELRKGYYFWMVGNKKINNMREMITEILRINAKPKPTEGGSIDEGHNGFVRVVYGYGKGTNTQYIQFTEEDAKELRRAGRALGIPDDKLYHGNDKEIEARVESAKKLMKLGKAMLIFANDHNEKYPENLNELLKDRLVNEDDLAWLTGNIEYLGDKVKLVDRPDAILAYDKTLLMQKNSQGTNVLYNDSHISFEETETLKKLGIKTESSVGQVEGASESADINDAESIDPNAIKEDFKNLAAQLINYRRSQGYYPETLEQLSASVPKDVYSLTNDDYHYESNRKRFILSSCGQDGIYGNDDDEIFVGSNIRISSRTGQRHELYPLEEGDNNDSQTEFVGPSNRRPTGNCSISGKVISSVTGEPVGHARAYLFNNKTNDALFIDVASDGTFVFKDIPTGPFSLRIIHTAGYEDKIYNPENKSPGHYPSFSLKEGEQRSGILFELEPACSISGKITDENGRLPSDIDTLTAVAWFEREDGKGYKSEQARINCLDGSYFIDGLNGKPAYLMVLNWRAAKQGNAYPPIYYPGTFSRDEAKLITFDKEQEIKGVDIRLQKEGGLILEGIVVDEEGRPVSEAFVVVHRRDMLFDFVTAYTDEQGNYQIQGLGNGEFLVHADAVHHGLVRTRIPLDIDSSNQKTKLDFILKVGVTISGKIVDVDSNDWEIVKSFGYASVTGHASVTDVNGPRLSFSLTDFRNKYRPKDVSNGSGGSFDSGEGDYSGGEMLFPTKSTFILQGLMPGQTLITFLPKTEGQIVKEILYNGQNIMETGIETKPGQEIKDVTIVIGKAESLNEISIDNLKGEPKEANPAGQVEKTSKADETDKLASENLTAEGWALWRQRKLVEAEKKFKAAAKKDPTNDGAYQGLGWAQLNQGKKLNAKNSFEKCVEINPKNSAALNGLGWIAHGRGNKDEAIAWWEKAIAAQPGATASLSGLTQVYMERKQYDEAIKYYNMWLAVEPDNSQAKAGLKEAKAAIRDK